MKIFYSALVFLITSHVSAAPILFYMEREQGSSEGCNLLLRDLETNKTKKILTAEHGCPDSISWDKNGQQSLFTLGGQYYSFKWSEKPKLKRLPRFKFPKGAWGTEYWISSKSDKQRVAFLLEVPDANLHAANNDSWYAIFEGKKYTLDHLPPWGITHMALVYELQGKSWKRLAVRPTKSEAGDTPHLSVLEEYFDASEELSTLRPPWEWGGCSFLGGENFDKWWKDHKYLFDERAEDVFCLSLARKDGLFAAIFWGDTPHLGPPVYYCQNQCEKMVRLEGDFHSQIHLEQNAGWVLVDYEYGGREGIWIYRLPSKDTLTIAEILLRATLELPHAQSATFFPFTHFWNRLK